MTEIKTTLSKVDVKERTILINEDIKSKTIEEAILGIQRINDYDDKQEELLNKYKREPIKVIVDSYGGSVYDGFGLVNLIASSKTPVHTYCYSKAMSMGFLIFISGHKRFIHKNAVLMYHQTSGGAMGTAQDVTEQAKNKKYLNKRIRRLVVDRTDITKEQLKEKRVKKQDWYLYSKEAISLNAADALIKDRF